MNAESRENYLITLPTYGLHGSVGAGGSVGRGMMMGISVVVVVVVVVPLVVCLIGGLYGAYVVGCHPYGRGPKTLFRIWLRPLTRRVNSGSTTPVTGLTVGRIMATGAPPLALGK